MKVKTSNLTGPALDWAVRKALGKEDIALHLFWEYRTHNDLFHYSTDPAQGHPIIEREGIGLFCNRTPEVGARFTPDAGADWRAFPYNRHMEHHYGPTPLIAAMRCFVASRLGDEVDVPEELE